GGYTARRLHRNQGDFAARSVFYLSGGIRAWPKAGIHMSHSMSLSGVKRTRASALHMPAFDPKRTSILGSLDLRPTRSRAPRLASLSRNVRQPNCVLANWIAAHKAEWRPGPAKKGSDCPKNKVTTQYE